jgi:hypothetical protein
MCLLAVLAGAERRAAANDERRGRGTAVFLHDDLQPARDGAPCDARASAAEAASGSGAGGGSAADRGRTEPQIQGRARVAYGAGLAALDSDSTLRRRLRHYVNPTLLVIDEVGYLSYSNRSPASLTAAPAPQAATPLPRPASDEFAPSSNAKDDRDCRGRSFGRRRGGVAPRSEDGHMAAHQLGHDGRQAIVLTLQRLVLHRHVPAIDVPPSLRPLRNAAA